MEFRRIPFQFSSTDPAKRQAELQKRFGLPVNTPKDKMHIDFENPGLMGFRPNDKSSASNSPRLQHRVPIFVDGDPEPMKSSIESQGSPVSGRKPHVRVIPIEMEDDDMSTKRHRNLSGPANTNADRPCHNGTTWLPEEFAPYVRPPVMHPKPPTKPQERTIPIQVEGVQNKKAKTVPVQKPKSVYLKKETGANHVSKEEKPVTRPKAWSGPALSLNKIEVVLEKLKTYQQDVEKFMGTEKDKHYRYLDEMLTRLMLELDDIDTMGNEEVRLSRKAAIKQVQASLDLLEAKVTNRVSEEKSIKCNSVDVQNEVEGSQDVEMKVSTSQEENIKDNEDGTSTVPDERVSKLSDESVSETEQLKVEDVVMENCDEQGMEKKVPEETTEVAGNDSQIMEVDKNIECETTGEPVVTTVDSPIQESKAISESKETINMPIELENDEETSVMKGSEEPVVTLAESPVKGMNTDNEISHVNVPNEETSLLEEKPQVSACAEERITVSSRNVSCDEVPKLEPNNLETNEHSNITNTEHSPEVLNNELVSN